MMQTVQESIDNMRNDNQINVDINSSDLEAQDLFNQIDLQQVHKSGENANHGDNQSNPFQNDIQQENQNNTPKKLKKTKKLQLDSDGSIDDKNNQEEPTKKQKKLKKNKSSKKDKKQRKLQKKLKKKMKKQRKQNGLKKLRKQGQEGKQQSNNEQWSGESSESQQQQSDVSSDSLLQRLNPKKLKNNSSKKKQFSVQKKQGFNLKQLGNDAQVNLQNQPQQDDSYGKSDKKNKKKVQKKEVQKNQNMLRQLLDIGFCQEQQSQQQNKQHHNYDDGLEQIMNMKSTKKKGPKMANKLFGDMQIKDEQINNELTQNLIQLQVKPRVSSGPSSITSSFLSKAQKIKKSRGMESEMQNQQYQKIISSKAKQSMSKLINQKQLQQADEIELNVKVPEVVKGRVELNNSIFFKRTASETFNNIEANSASAKKKRQLELSGQNNVKISRLDLFKSISSQVKTRKSKDVTHQLIKNSFKVTQLEQIQQMRKKNQQKRRKQALRGSDDQQQVQEQNQNVQAQVVPQQQIKQHNLNFLNFKIEVQNANKQQVNANIQNNNQNKQQLEVQNQHIINKQVSMIAQVSQQNQHTNKSKQFKIQIQNAISDKQYKKLLQLQEGQGEEQMEQEGDQDVDKLLQLQDNDEDEQQKQQRDLDNMELQYGVQQNSKQEPQNQNDKNLPTSLKNAQKVELQVDLQVLNEQSLSQQSSSVQQQQEIQEPANPQYQQYLNELEEEGIKIKNNISRITKQNNTIIDHSQKENDQKIQNSQHFSQTYNNASNSNKLQNGYSGINYDEARREFKKLRKIATILKTKKKRMMRTKRAGEFYEQQAEQGSDNEEHDDQVKKINDDDEAKQYEGLDLDAELEQLIDNAVDINQQNQELAFQKYMEDIKIQDREELKKIMRGEFKRRNDQEAIMEQMQEDEKQRLKRMEQFEQYMKKRDLQDGQDLYVNEQINSNEQSNDDSQNGERKKQMKEPANAQVIQQEVQQMNQQNLKRYLDDCLLDSYRPTKIVTVVKPILLPQSYQRTKKTQMRNTMKSKQSNEQIKPLKLKKTSSHLNELIMKNKQKIKPLGFTKNLPMIKFGKK